MLTIIEKVLFLQQVPMLASVPTEALAHLASVAREEHVSPGRALWEPGDAADAVYFIVEGEVSVAEPDHGTFVASAGMDVGTSALVADTPTRDTSARVVSEATLLHVERDDFFDVLAEHPEIARALLRALGTRLGGEVRRLDTPDEAAESSLVAG